MKSKVSEATPIQLDWLVATCLKHATPYLVCMHQDNKGKWHVIMHGVCGNYSPSTDWAQGGPIIEREFIAARFWKSEGAWAADVRGGVFEQYGPTALIAAMRCFVASKLGDEVEIPDELS